MNFKFWKKTMQTHNILETYDYPVFDNLKIVDTNINLMIPLLEKVLNKKQNIQIFCRGSSGLVIAMALQKELNNLEYKSQIAFVRKDSEKSHGCSTSIISKAQIIVVDDFVATGTTIRTIIDYLNSFESKPNIVAFCVKGFTALFSPKNYKTLKIVIE